jgi:hypothetical protein
MVLPLVTMPTTPRGVSPRFEFSLFVPGLPDSRGWPKCYSKGHLGPNHRGTWADKDPVYAWVNRIAAAAAQKRTQLQLAGYHLFPYPRAVQVSAVFTHHRPHTQPYGPPIVLQSDYGVGDTDGLQKALGDALVVAPARSNYPKAGIIKDDRLIARWHAEKAFVDQIDWEDQKPAAGVWFRVEAYDDTPIKISNFV